jgi:succinoglycan biosynthesis transport protein ExoP
MNASKREPETLRDYLQVVRRRKWAFLFVLVATPLAAVAISMQHKPLYAATAQVLLSRQNLANTLTGGGQDPTLYLQAERFAQTQADLAEVGTVAQRTLCALGLTDRTPAQLLDQVSVKAKVNADILSFRAVDASPTVASQIATEYARQYTLYRKEIDTTALQRAEIGIERQIRALELRGDTKSPLYSSLVEKDQQLKTLEALQTSNAFLFRWADQGTKVQPQPVKSALIGLVLGLLGALGLAFLWEALDTRIRSAELVAEHLGLTLLGRLPPPPREIANANRLVMLHDPNDDQAEAFRMLRTNLEFANLDRGARTIMVTSAVQDEGKSTTVANLAVALARGGRHIVLVDLDLRRPSQRGFFDLGARPGLTQVALGQASLDEATARIDLGPHSGDWIDAQRRNGNGRVPGTLEVLGTGPLPPNPGEFLATRALQDILAQLASKAHLVLIDAPPLLALGDALALTAKVDAIFVVSRLKVVRRQLIDELKRVLDLCRAHKLGFVITGANEDESYGFGYGYADPDPDPVPKLLPADRLELVHEAKSA